MSRTTSRNYTNAFLRQGAEATPGPKVSQDIQLVQIIDDTTLLSLPLPAPSKIVGASVALAPVGRFAVFQLLAPSNRVLVIPEIIGDAVQNVTVGIGVGATPANLVVPPGLSWGPAPVGTVRAGDVAPGSHVFPTNSFTLGLGLVFNAQPIVLQQGELLQVAATGINTAFSMQITWREIGN